VNAAFSQPVQPLPGLQPVTVETISLLEGTGVPIREVVAVQDKFRSKVSRTRSTFLRSYYIAKTAKQTARLLKNPDDVSILVFVLLSQIDDLRGKNRAQLLAESRNAFQGMGEEKFRQLSNIAGQHLANSDFAERATR
jgi:hypothetical protein